MSSGEKPNYPLVYAEEPFIRLAIAYNPFDLSDITKHELVYDQDKTLADYLEGLPVEAGWSVGYNGQPVSPETWASIKPEPFSNIVIVRTPHGGRGGGKNVMRIVALIAIAAFAAWAGPALASSFTGLTTTTAGTTALTATGTAVAGAFSAGITMAGGMLINALLPATPGRGNQEESATYGLDGPKNTAKEGVVVPVGYGEHRVAGNITDFFTRNIGREQYVFIRTVLNQGEIEAIEDIEINGQPISAFSDVQVRKRFGKETEEPNDWFDESTRLISHNIHVTQDFQERMTTGEVDRLRVDLVFPYGLYSIDQDDGSTKDERQVTLELEYAPCDQLGNLTGSWQTFPIVAQRPLSSAGAGVMQTSTGSTTAVMQVQTHLQPGSPTNNYRIEGFYRKAGTTQWISAGAMMGTAVIEMQGLFNPVIVWPVVPFTFHFPDAGQYEMRVEGGTIAGSGASYSLGQETSATSLTIKDRTTKPLRLTYEGGHLPRGYYMVRIRRTTPEKQANGKTVDYVFDECYVTDIGEIDATPVNLNGIANLSLCIKVDDQLTGIPTVTARCKLSKVKIYNEDGEVVQTAWSDNPADIVGDILFNEVRGAGFSTNKMVWSSYLELREFCEEEGLKFNGVFDTVNTLWDAVQVVAKVGHATLVPRGTKFSFAIDRAADPVALFTPANIYKDTFKKTWLSLTDRANEIQLKFANKEDGYKENTVRLADHAAFARGAKQKIVDVGGFGITDLEQAFAEAEYHARQNSYIRSFVEFDAPLEAIGVSIGDVVLVQHDSVDFYGGVGGRLKAGSTTTVVNLDRPVTMLSGKSYSLLAFHSALKRYDVSISSISGSRAVVSGLPSGEPNRVLRLKQGSVDVEIVDVIPGAGSHTLILGDTSGLSAGAAELWDLDVIEERPVVTVPGTTETVTVSIPFTLPPEEYANFLFGQQSSVKMPFRVRSIGGDGIERRTLALVQYDERCYQKGGWDVPAVTGPGGGLVDHVRNLFADYTRTPAPDQQRIPVTLSWQKPMSSIYGGADIHIYENDRWHLIGSVNDVTEFRSDFNRGEVVRFRVVAFNENRVRARFHDAPTVIVSLEFFEIVLPELTGLWYEIYWRNEPTIRVHWDEPALADGYYRYRVQHKRLTQEQFEEWQSIPDPEDWPEYITGDEGWTTEPHALTNQADIPNVDLGTYAVRVRAEKGYHASPWGYVPVDVAASDIPVPITNLTLVGGKNGPGALDDEFTGPDANWTWDDILTNAAGYLDPKTNLPLVFQDYQVRILDEEGVLIRTEYVTSPNYSYTYSKNNADTPDEGLIKARRKFKIEVRIRGKQGQLGIPALQTVENPPPKRPTGVIAFADQSAMFVKWDECQEPDYNGTVVWMGTDELFEPDETNRMFAGKANGARIPISETQQYYVRVGHYDTFDDNPVNITGAYGAFVPAIVADELADLVEQGAELIETVGEFKDDVQTIGKTILQLGLKVPEQQAYVDALARLKGEPINTYVERTVTELQDEAQAVVEIIDLIGAVHGEGEARSFHINWEKLMASPEESLLQRLDRMETTFGEAVAAAFDEIELRTGPGSAIVTRIGGLSGTIADDINAAIISHQNLMLGEDGLIVNDMDGIAGQVAEAFGQISDERELRIDADAVFTRYFSSMGSWVEDPEGGPGAGAFVFDETKTQTNRDGGMSLASRLSGLQASAVSDAKTEIKATIASESFVKADPGGGSIVYTLDSLALSMYGSTGSVTQLAQVVQGPGGLTSKYGLAVEAGGYISGYQAMSGPAGGSFVIMANHFAIVDSFKSNLRVPFIYTGGIVKMQNIEVDTIAAGVIKAHHIEADNIAVTTRSWNDSPVTVGDAYVFLGSHTTYLTGKPTSIEVWTNIQNSGGGSIGVNYYCSVSGPVPYTTRNWGHYTVDGVNGPYNSTTFVDRFAPGVGGTYTFSVYGRRAGGGSLLTKTACTITITDHKTQTS